MLIINGQGGMEHEMSGSQRNATNNQMELTAVCEALEWLSEPSDVTLYTDSQYVKKGITEWLSGWIARNWRNSKGDPVANQDLWQRLIDAKRRHTVRFEWLRGHAGHVYNERVDQLAVWEVERLQGKHTRMIEAAKDTAPAVPQSTADIQIHVATSCENRAKLCGWGVVMVSAGGEQVLSGTVTSGGDYYAALMAVVHALEHMPPVGTVAVFVDNETVMKGASAWIKKWRANDWRKADGEPVMHKLMWVRLDAVAHKRTIQWDTAQYGAPIHTRALQAAKSAQ